MEDNKGSVKKSTIIARRKAVKKYREKCEQIVIQLPKGTRDLYKAAAESVNMSMNTFAIMALNEKVKRDTSIIIPDSSSNNS